MFRLRVLEFAIPKEIIYLAPMGDRLCSLLRWGQGDLDRADFTLSFHFCYPGY